MPSSVSLFATASNEESLDKLHAHFSLIAQQMRGHCSSVSVSTNTWTEDEALQTDAEGELYHDEQTLKKVHAAVRDAVKAMGAAETFATADLVAQAVINSILNEGVLFREVRRA